VEELLFRTTGSTPRNLLPIETGVSALTQTRYRKKTAFWDTPPSKNDPRHALKNSPPAPNTSLATIVVESAIMDFLARIPGWVWICLSIGVVGLRFAYSFLAKHPR